MKKQIIEKSLQGVVLIASMICTLVTEARQLTFINNTSYTANVNVEFGSRWIYPTRCRGQWADVPAHETITINTSCQHALDYINVIVREPSGDKRIHYFHRDINSREYIIETIDDNGRYYIMRSDSNVSSRVPVARWGETLNEHELR